MKGRRLRIYGDEKRFKQLVTRYIELAENHLDQAKGVRKRVERAGAGPHSLEAFVAQDGWLGDVGRWRGNVVNAATRYLGENAEVLLPKVTQGGPPPDTGKPRHARHIETVEPWLREATEELRALRDALGVQRNVAAVAAPLGRFEELRASGLVDKAVIDGYSRELKDPRTPKQLYDAIGAAKEIGEATLRAALDRLGVSWAPSDDLPRLMKKWRTEVEAVAPPDPKGAASLDKAQSALANVVNFLAEWRNSYGRGHGRSHYPPGLQRRHARLAADSAETAIRFVVTTMDDLGRLPPPPPGR